MYDFKKTLNLIEKEIDILTVGELLIDMISTEYGDDFQSSTYQKHFGGSPANIALNTKKLGLNSLIVGAVGKDGLGDFIINTVKNAGVETKYINRVDYSTSMVLVTKSKATPIPIFYRDADYHIYYSKKIEEIVKNSKIIHFSCWPISKSPARETIEKIIDIAKKNNTLICFDPNYHPMIWEKGHQAIDYIKWIIGNVDIIKPSEDDAERIFGKDLPQNQIEKFLKLGAKLVIMTLGKDGALMSNGKETISLNSVATEVIDTTGAGDAFWSGFYAGLVRHYKVLESLQMGLKASAIKLKTVGALLKEVQFEDLLK